MSEDLWSSQAPLSNDQFRQLLETPVAKRKEAIEERHIARVRAERRKKREEASEAQEHFTTILQNASDDEEEVEQLQQDDNFPFPSIQDDFQQGHSTLYRDRAKERREGKQLDQMEIETSERKVEDTKFLGGDLEHTHLVKGLDYALLNKERAKLEKSEAEKAKRKKEEEKAKQQSKEFTFSTSMGRAVFDAFFKNGKGNVKDFDKPGRTAYLYDFENAQKLDCIPTVLRRSKSEAQAENAYILAGVDSAVVDQLAKIMSYFRSSSTSGKHDKKQRKKEKQMLLATMLSKESKPSKEQKPKPAINITPLKEEPVPEDDIFEDAGIDYICELSKDKKPINKAKTDMSRVEPLSVDEEQDPVKGIKDLVGDEKMEVENTGNEDRVKRKKHLGKEMDPTGLPDHYSECYPSFHQSYAGVVMDSDDEDLSHMDTREKGQSRYNFETEEEWSQYKNKIEQLPKAAFQYGVKMTEGRKTQSKLAEKHRKEQKLDSQLNKIEKIFKDQGHSHDTAFRSDKGQDSRKEDISQSCPTPKNRKRIRLDQSHEPS